MRSVKALQLHVRPHELFAFKEERRRKRERDRQTERLAQHTRLPSENSPNNARQQQTQIHTGTEGIRRRCSQETTKFKEEDGGGGGGLGGFGLGLGGRPASFAASPKSL